MRLARSDGSEAAIIWRHNNISGRRTGQIFCRKIILPKGAEILEMPVFTTRFPGHSQ